MKGNSLNNFHLHSVPEEPVPQVPEKIPDEVPIPEREPPINDPIPHQVPGIQDPPNDDPPKR